jgi:hypothetical protein
MTTGEDLSPWHAWVWDRGHANFVELRKAEVQLPRTLLPKLFGK